MYPTYTSLWNLCSPSPLSLPFPEEKKKTTRKPNQNTQTTGTVTLLCAAWHEEVPGEMIVPLEHTCSPAPPQSSLPQELSHISPCSWELSARSPAIPAAQFLNPMCRLFVQKSPNYFKMRETKCKIEKCHKYEVLGRRGASFQTQIIKTPSFTAIVIACNGSTWKLLSQTSSVNIFPSNPCSTRSLPGHAHGLKHERLHAHAINSFIAFLTPRRELGL